MTNDKPDAVRVPARLVVVGAGRAGGALARAARAAGIEVAVARRGEARALAAAAEAVLLCVPDAELERVAREVADAEPPPRLVGHVSGASPLDVLSAAREAGAATFSLHPLQTIPHPETDLGGAPCAVAGSHDAALDGARALARALGMEPFTVPEEARAAYHAAAAMASNFLIALEESAAELLAAVGVERPRDILAPLVLRSAANWAESGREALTGPIARGDEGTVARHLEALRRQAPQLLPLYEALAARTRAVARGEEAG
jgi:predicted short-subunit dehydrogenase-like oxidoreductase (DUF2520 family)